MYSRKDEKAHRTSNIKGKIGNKLARMFKKSNSSIGFGGLLKSSGIIGKKRSCRLDRTVSANH